jgi:hypothetical protein
MLSKCYNFTCTVTCTLLSLYLPKYRICVFRQVYLFGNTTCNTKRLKIKIDSLIIYCFTSYSRFFHLYGNITITREGMQKLGLCSVLRAIQQVGTFILSHTKVFPVSSKGTPHSVASYDTQWDVENLF